MLAAKQVRELFESRLADTGSSLANFLVLDHLSRLEGRSQRELANHLHVEAPTLTRHLDRMAMAGLIKRRKDPDDRRVTRVDMTTSGRSHYRRMAGVIGDLNSALTSLMTEDELQKLVDLLERLASFATHARQARSSAVP